MPRTRRACATRKQRWRGAEALIDKQVVTEAALDQARFAVEGFKAGIAAGRRSLESQKTQLDYLTIRAPITGRTGGLNAKLGATVRAQDAARARDDQPDAADPGRLLAAPGRSARAAARAHRQGDGRDQSARRARADGRRARSRFIDNQVDKTDRIDRRQGGGGERRRDAVAGPVGRGRRSPSRSSRACWRCRRARCCRRSRA